MGRQLSFWIKERHNPQLGTYYVAMGQMTVRAANRYVRITLYGDNIMHCFKSREEYDERLKGLRQSGAQVQ